MWRELIWPHFDIREKHCVKSVLKSCGKYVKRLSFPDRVAPTQLKILRHCNNLVELSIPTSTLDCNQLSKVMKNMEILRSLDILWTSEIHLLLQICNGLKELTVRLPAESCFSKTPFKKDLNLWIEKWVMSGFQPQTLNVVGGQYIPLVKLVDLWHLLNPHSPTGHTAWLS